MWIRRIILVLAWPSSVLKIGVTANLFDETSLLQKDIQVSIQRKRAARISAGLVESFHGSPIPCHIHQTWKSSKWEELPAWVQSSVSSFKLVNPGCNHTLWSDTDVKSFMARHYPHLEAFQALTPVQRADIFRYAVIHSLGGFYADSDVDCLKPIQEWGLASGTELAVGYETGFHLTEEERKKLGFGRNEQLEQWMFAAVAGHPALKRCLELFETKREWGVEDTIELTGPSLFSDSVHEYLWRYGKARHRDGNANASLRFPPGPGPPGSKAWIFSADQVASPGATAGDESNHLLVRHRFKGTWKKDSSTASQ